MPCFKFKLIGKVNEWNVLMETFKLGMPGGDVEIMTNDIQLTEHLIEAMKNRDNISITIGEEN